MAMICTVGRSQLIRLTESINVIFVLCGEWTDRMSLLTFSVNCEAKDADCGTVAVSENIDFGSVRVLTDQIQHSQDIKCVLIRSDRRR